MCLYVHWALNPHYFMSVSMSTVLVFKTSVSSSWEVGRLSPLLNALINENGHWNFDLEDCDNIFRVETQCPDVSAITRLFQNLGFLCEEI